MWKEGIFEVISSFKGDGFLGIKLGWKGDVYSPCSLALKKKLWKELLKGKSKFDDNKWCMGGDFNASGKVESVREVNEE